MKIIAPKSSEEFNKYYNLRYEMLRKPWGQPLGSERDGREESSIHRMIIGNESEEVLAVGRLQYNSIDETQIRYMAVVEKYQGLGLGSQILSTLEGLAQEKGAKRMILQARDNAIQFYKNNGYVIVEKTHLLFDKIQHYLMEKEIY